MDKVFLIGEHKDGALKRATLEILGELNKQGASPTVVLLGGPGLEAVAKPLGEHGAKTVVLLESAELAQYSTEGFANAVYAYLKDLSPTAVFAPASATGKDFLPRVAGKFKVGIAADCTELKLDGGKVVVRRPMYSGKCSKTVTFTKSPAIASVRPNVLPKPAATGGNADVQKVAAQVGTVRAVVKSVVAGAAKKVELTEADIIISGGRSLKNAENFKILFECAAVIGAAVGASRAAVDAGYAPHDMQVGQTGKTVSPKLYIACGISGAIQHLAGMRTSKIIVAINKDPEAPIFQRADYGIVGDIFEVVPKLTEELKKLKASS